MTNASERAHELARRLGSIGLALKLRQPFTDDHATAIRHP